MSTENQIVPQDPVTTTDIKGSGNFLPLPSPEPTPEVEDGRIKADRQREAAALKQPVEVPSASPGETYGHRAVEPVSGAGSSLGEVPAEIQRILGCSDTSYAEILGVKPDSTVREKTAAWRRLGCLLHENVTKHPGAKRAFEKLQTAAKEQNVNHLDIDEVTTWDGEEKLPDLDEDEPMGVEEDAIPVPPPAVMSVYKDATTALHHLGEYPDDPAALQRVNELNQKISKINAAEKTALGADALDISPDRWCIPLAFFAPHYNLVRDNYKILWSDRTNQSARDSIAKEKALIDAFIKKHHFPEDWTVLTADEHLQGEDERAATAENIKPTEGQAVILYPWVTALAADGSLIVGVRRQGPFGTQACIETQEEDGRVIRRLQSASEVGLLEVNNYLSTHGFKNLAEGQSQWSFKDRNDFEELLWVTKSHTKRKNVAAGKKDPSADCCVKFRSKGVQILTVSSFSKVLGPSSAKAKIEEVCRRDNISPPWDAGNISEYHDPSRLEKNSARRRALQDAQASSSIDGRLDPRNKGFDGAVGKEDHMLEQLGNRVISLENDMKDTKAMAAALNKNMEILIGMFQQFAPRN